MILLKPIVKKKNSIWGDRVCTKYDFHTVSLLLESHFTVKIYVFKVVNTKLRFQQISIFEYSKRNL